MNKSYITEASSLIITLCATGAVCLNQLFDTPIDDPAVTAFATAAATAIVPLVLRTIHKRRGNV